MTTKAEQVATLLAQAAAADRDAASEFPGSYYRKAHKARARRLLAKADALASDRLTPAQERLLTRVRERGVLVLNDRARKPLLRLEELGLVTVDWDTRDSVKGSGITITGRNTVRPA